MTAATLTRAEHARVVDGDPGGGVTLAARLEPGQIVGHARRVVARLESRLAVEGALRRGDADGGAGFGEAIAKGLDAVRGDFDAGGRVVPTEADERLTRPGERVVDGESGGGARRAAARLR